MRSRKILAALSAGVVILLACADSTGPPGPWPDPEDVVGNPELHVLRWAAPAPLRFAVEPTGGEGVEYFPAAVPRLDRYEVAFWATYGQAATAQINYLASDGSWLPFLTVALDKTSLLAQPGGEPFRSGDKVLITVRVDSVQMRVYLGPVGLRFSSDKPTRLSLWYTGANPDLNGDGRVDALDEEIENGRLCLWTQKETMDTWERLDATHLIDSKQFNTDLSGYAISFSGYAVSY